MTRDVISFQQSDMMENEINQYYCIFLTRENKEIGRLDGKLYRFRSKEKDSTVGLPSE